MSIRLGSAALAATVVAAAAWAMFGAHASASSPPEPVPEPAPQRAHEPSSRDALPPGHPPIPSAGAHATPRPPEGPPALAWKAPAAWTEAPNPSSMRLATYHPPRAPGDTEDAELSVSRAGGSTAANIERWVAQFDDAGKDTRDERTVSGLKVTVVDVSGTYAGGAMLGASSRHPGYRLLGAVVEAKGSSYFFKLTGPSATVSAARPAFDAMIASLKPAG
ncbi:MAG TPA: hypothetical protein VGM56_28180 [Byssovorax sp.]|jgi:hypothetical protein